MICALAGFVTYNQSVWWYSPPTLLWKEGIEDCLMSFVAEAFSVTVEKNCWCIIMFCSRSDFSHCWEELLVYSVLGVFDPWWLSVFLSLEVVSTWQHPPGPLGSINLSVGNNGWAAKLPPLPPFHILWPRPTVYSSVRKQERMRHWVARWAFLVMKLPWHSSV